MLTIASDSSMTPSIYIRMFPANEQLALYEGWKRRDPEVMARLEARRAQSIEQTRLTPPSRHAIALSKVRILKPIRGDKS